MNNNSHSQHHRHGASVWLAALGISGSFVQHTATAETRSYVLSWIVPAMYAHEGDCQVIQPVSDPGRNSPLESLYRKLLAEGGKTPAEIEALAAAIKGDVPKYSEPVAYRGRIDGKPVNVYQNPESVPDPKIH